MFKNPRQLQGHINKLHNRRSILKKAMTSESSEPMLSTSDATSKKETVRKLTQEEATDMAKVRKILLRL
jgi:hypothetical protein